MDTLFAQAEKAFHEGMSDCCKPAEAQKHFRRSAKSYSQLSARGVCSAALYRNLGNASLLGGDLSGAVLAYHRGLRLAPDDATLRVGLQTARERVANTVVRSFGAPPEPFLPPWVPDFSGAIWISLTFVTYSLACLLVTRWRMTRQAGLVWALLSISLLFVVSLSILVQRLRLTHWEATHPLVVVAAERSYLYKGDGASYPRFNAAVRQWIHTGLDSDASALPAGVEARLLFERGDWLQIRLSGGETGWVPKSAVVIGHP
jgi:hypothetical protein